MKKTLLILSAMFVVTTLVAPFASQASGYTSNPKRTPGVNLSTRRQSIAFTTPDNGAVASRGQTVTIAWTSVAVAKVTVNLRKNGVHYKTIVSNVTNNGSISWTVPSDIKPGTNYSLRVLSGDELVSDVRNIVIQ